MSAATQIAVDQDTSWQVTREGMGVATIAVKKEQGEVVVVAETPASEKPYRFDSFEAADAFLSDLMTTFSYLGCDIAVTSA